MATTLATPSFVSGAREDLAAVDVYNKKDDSVVNNTFNVLKQAAPSTIAALRGGSSMKSLLPLASTVSASLTGGLLGSALKKLDDINPYLANSTYSKALKGLTPAVSSFVSSAITAKLSGQSLSKLGTTALLGQVSSKLLTASIPDAKSLTGAIGSITGNDKIASFINKDATVGMVSGLVTSAIHTGTPGAFTALKGQLTSPSMVSGVVKSCLPATISKSSLSTLAEFAGLGGKVVKQASPSILTDFSKNYDPPLALDNNGYKDAFTQIKDTYTSVDPDWNKSVRVESSGNTDTAVDLSCAFQGSDEFKKTLTTGAYASDNPDDKMYLLTGAYKYSSPDVELQKNFPLVEAVPKEDPAKPAADPQTVATIVEPTRNPQWTKLEALDVDTTTKTNTGVEVPMVIHYVAYLSEDETLVKKEMTSTLSDGSDGPIQSSKIMPRADYKTPTGPNVRRVS